LFTSQVDEDLKTTLEKVPLEGEKKPRFRAIRGKKNGWHGEKIPGGSSESRRVDHGTARSADGRMEGKNFAGFKDEKGGASEWRLTELRERRDKAQ